MTHAETKLKNGKSLLVFSISFIFQISQYVHHITSKETRFDLEFSVTFRLTRVIVIHRWHLWWAVTGISNCFLSHWQVLGQKCDKSLLSASLGFQSAPQTSDWNGILQNPTMQKKDLKNTLYFKTEEIDLPVSNNRQEEL